MENMIVVLDTSGSMGDTDKKSLVRYILYSLQGLIKDEFSDIEYKIYKWGEEITEAGKINEINFQNRINDREIINFLNQHKIGKFLFITDGNFQRTLVNKMASWFNENETSVHVLSVGSDANVPMLRRVFGKDNVFESFDIATCIKNL